MEALVGLELQRRPPGRAIILSPFLPAASVFEPLVYFKFIFFFVAFGREASSRLLAFACITPRPRREAAPRPASPRPASCPRPGGGTAGRSRGAGGCWAPPGLAATPAPCCGQPCRPVFLLLLNFFIVPPSFPPPPSSSAFLHTRGFSRPGSPKVWPESRQIMGGRMESCVNGFGGKTSTYRTKVLPVLEREACM